MAQTQSHGVATRSSRLPIPRAWRGLQAPAPTIRLRLTALYTAVYAISGAVLLTIGYLLLRSNLHSRHDLRAALMRHGLHPVIGGALGFPAGSPQARFSGENLGERIALTGPADELRELADTFDGMLARLDRAFASQRHFVANASHELRTPLAIMRTEVDVALADPEASSDELRGMGEAILETVDRCEHLIASLLLLARSHATTGHEELVDIAAVVGDCVTDLRARAEDAQIQIRSELVPAWVDADPGLLERLIANLLDNGIHHNVPGGFLSVKTEVHDRRLRLLVANGGARIESDDIGELAEPFRRLKRSGSGFGLGLSIVRSVAEAHGGTVMLSAPASGGLVVVVELPSPRTAHVPRPGRTEALPA